MTFPFFISERLKRKLDKLGKKDKQLAINLSKKIEQITNADFSTINHFKNLKKPLNHLKRVHVGSFVLTFQFRDDSIIFEDLAHHDKAY